jgi:two-component system sensor histidine kinase UhpB
MEATALYISPQIKDLIGYTQAEWTSSPDFWKRLVHPEDLQQVQNEVERCVTTGEKTISEYRIKTKDDRWIWVRDEAVAIKDNDDRPQFIHGVLIDITEQKTAEQALKQREAISQLLKQPNCS